ncbi:MAG: hypothetical protein GX896_05655 [Clostridiales bacterium]|nr:hypothetical protein [Clostridiales bacterium]
MFIKKLIQHFKWAKVTIGLISPYCENVPIKNFTKNKTRGVMVVKLPCLSINDEYINITYGFNIKNCIVIKRTVVPSNIWYNSPFIIYVC